MNFLIKNIKKHTSNEISESQMADLNRLYDDHIKNKTYLHNSFKIIAKQIELGIEDIYERHYRIKNELKPRDSSSLNSFVIKYGEKHGKNMFDEKNSKTAITLKSFEKRYGKDLAQEKYREYCIKKGTSLEGFIMRFGEIEGRIRHKEYWENTNFSTKKEKFIERYGQNEGTLKYEETLSKIGYANTVDYYIEKYGEAEGISIYNEINEKKKKSQSKSTMIEKMLDQGNTLDEISLAIEDRWSNSRETYIRKHGEIEGNKKYEEYVSNLKINNPICIEYYRERNIEDDIAYDIISEIQFKRQSKNNFYSKESMRTILPFVHEIENQLNIKCLYGENEFHIRLRKEENHVSNKRFLFYDFTFPDISLIIEYHGVRFHEKLDYDKTKNMNFNDFTKDFKIDYFKKWVAEQRGFDVIIVRSWEKKKDVENLLTLLNGRGIKLCQTILL